MVRHVILGLLFLGCNGDGPTDRTQGLDVSGTWLQTGIVMEDTCGLAVLGLVAVFSIEQNGERLTLRFPSTIRFPQGRVIEGSIDPGTGDFTVPDVVVADGLPLGMQSGRFTSSRSYTAESTVSFAQNGTQCTLRTMDSGTRQT